MLINNIWDIVSGFEWQQVKNFNQIIKLYLYIYFYCVVERSPVGLTVAANYLFSISKQEVKHFTECSFIAYIFEELT